MIYVKSKINRIKLTKKTFLLLFVSINIFFALICSFIIFELSYQTIRNKKPIALNQCPILYNKSHQYYALIDGVVYPKSVPLYQNKSINFDCLNLHSRDKKLKTILFWNTFFIRIIQRAKSNHLGI